MLSITNLNPSTKNSLQKGHQQSLVSSPLHEWSTRSVKSRTQSIARYTEQVETRIRLIRKVLSKHRTAKVSAQISPYWIYNFESAFYQGLHVNGEKNGFSGTTALFGSRERGLFGKHFQSAEQKNYLPWAYPNLSSLAHWLLKRRKKSKSLLKHRTVRIVLLHSLRIALEKSQVRGFWPGFYKLTKFIN